MTVFLAQISHFMYSYNSTGNSCFVAYNQTHALTKNTLML